VFFINVPIAVVVVAIALHYVPESRDDTTSEAIDAPGAALVAIGLGATTFGLIERSWPVGVIGIGLLVAFLAVERASRHPMLPLSLFSSRAFSACNAVTFVVYGAFGMVTFLLAITLQEGLLYSPLAAGASLFPVTIIMLVGSSRAGALAQRVGPRIPLTLGPMLIAAGLLLMTRITPGEPYATTTLPAAVVFGAGLALTVAPLTATVLASADQHRTGIAAGVNTAVARTAGLVFVAALPFIAGFESSASPGARVLVDALHRTAVVSAALCLGGALIAFAFVSRRDLTVAPEGTTPYAEREPTFHCGVGAPPLAVTTEP
jgi:hypothetical protein